MFRNFIKDRLIDVKQFSVSKLIQETAGLLKINPERIEEIQCWPHQLWIVIQGVGARCVSYRSLRSWIEQVVSVLRNTANLKELEQVGEIIAQESQKYTYEPEDLEQLRQVYAQQREHLQALQPAIEHQQAGQDWLEGWEKILKHCEDTSSLEYLAKQIKIQSQKYLDLPEIIAQLRQVWSDCWHNLVKTA